MKDIDFDELDRAVNSLMSTVSSDKPADAATPAQAAPIATGAASDDSAAAEQTERIDVAPVAPAILNLDTPMNTPESDAPQQADVETLTEAMQLVEETPTVAPAPAARRGRFMDVVRPAVREASKPVPSSAVSRQGISLQPRTPQPETPPAVPDVVNVQPNNSAALEHDATETFPSDFAAFENTESVQSPVPEATDVEAPLSSPFLPGAKVEKRPLGRSAEAAPVVDLAAELAIDAPEVAAESTVSQDSISPNKDAQLPEQPLPAELGSELLSIETSTDNLPPEASSPIASADEISQVNSASSPSTPPPRPMAGVSIPQQYKVQPQSPVQAAPSGAIYDAQPLVHTAEKKSSWIWKLVAIIAIALLGAGGGAAIYYLGLI